MTGLSVPHIIASLINQAWRRTLISWHLPVTAGQSLGLF
jgi:hypothetical protein